MKMHAEFQVENCREEPNQVVDGREMLKTIIKK
jgi:hypothetical protein